MINYNLILFFRREIKNIIDRIILRVPNGKHRDAHPMLKVCIGALFAGTGLFEPSVAVASNPGDPITGLVDVLAPSTRETRRSSQHVAASPAGRFVVVWTDSSDQSPSALRARLFNADGTPRTDELLVEPAQLTTFYESTQPVSMNSRGEFAVVSVARGPSSRTGFTTDHVYVQRFDSDGQPLGEKINVDEVPNGRGLPILGYSLERGGRFDNAAIMLTDSGDVTVAWTSHEYTGIDPIANLAQSSRLYARRFRADGSATGPAVLITSHVIKSINPELRIAVSLAGDYVVGYREDPLRGSYSGDPSLAFPFYIQRFSASGIRLGLPTQLKRLSYTDSEFAWKDFALCFTSNNDLMLAWEARVSISGSPVQQVRLQRFSPEGFARAQAVVVATRPVYLYPTSISVSALPAGGVAVSWPDLPDVPGEIVSGVAYGRYYAANDVPLGDAFPIAQDIQQVNSATDGRGNLFATFGDVFVRVFQGP